MALMQITIIPLGEGTSVGEHVAAVQRLLQQQDLPFQLNDMGTVIQGPANNLLALAARIHDLPFASGARRVVTQIVLDDRRDKKIELGDKTRAVQQRLR